MNTQPKNKLHHLIIWVLSIVMFALVACDNDLPGDTMTKSNPVHDPITSLSCKINPDWSGCK